MSSTGTQRAVDASGKPLATDKQAASTKKPAKPADDKRKRVVDDDEDDDDEDPGGFGWAVLAFFIPIVGLILWLVWRKTKPQPSKMSRNGFIASMVLAVIVGAAAATLGYMGLVNIPGLPGGQAPQSSQPPNSSGPTSWPDGVKTSVRDLQTGQCFNVETLTSTDGNYAWVMDCTSSHDSEITGIGEAPAGDYPATQELQQGVSSQVCGPIFLAYIGVPWYDSEIHAQSIIPDQQTWESGTRTVVCYANDPLGGLTVSMKNANR